MWLVLLLASGCAANRPLAVATISELSSNVAIYDGKEVTVRGYVVVKPHTRNIYDSKEGYEEPDGACLGLLASPEFFKLDRQRMETIHGIFRARLCGVDDVCLYWCGKAGIEVMPDE
jgi:hypothetical protein